MSALSAFSVFLKLAFLSVARCGELYLQGIEAASGIPVGAFTAPKHKRPNPVNSSKVLSTDQQFLKVSSPEARCFQAMTGVVLQETSRVYLHGGKDLSERLCFQDLWELNTVTHEWVKLWEYQKSFQELSPPVPRVAFGHTLDYVKGELVLFDLWRLRSAGGLPTWTKLASAPVALSGHAVAADGSQMFVHGGRQYDAVRGQTISASQALLVYDAVTDLWTSRQYHLRCHGKFRVMSTGWVTVWVTVWLMVRMTVWVTVWVTVLVTGIVVGRTEVIYLSKIRAAEYIMSVYARDDILENHSGSFRCIAADAVTGVIVSSSETVKVTEGTTSVLEVLIETGELGVDLLYDSCVGKDSCMVPAAAITVDMHQYQELGFEVEENMPLTESYSGFNQSNAQGRVVFPVYASLRHRLSFWHADSQGNAAVTSGAHRDAFAPEITIVESYLTANLVTIRGTHALMCNSILYTEAIEGTIPALDTLTDVGVNPGSTCQWIIQPEPPAQRIELVFDRSNLTKNDRILLFTKNKELIQSRQGSDSAPWVVTFSNAEIIVMYEASKADRHPLGSGFIATYSSVSSNENLYMIMIAVGVFTITILFLIGFLYLWRNMAICMHLHIYFMGPEAAARQRAAAEASAAAQEPASRALHKDAVDRLATAIYQLRGGAEEGVGDDEGEATCSICLEEFEELEMYCELPCKHNFHHECIRLWFQRERVCPLCKQDVAVMMGVSPPPEGISQAMAAAK
eukprot:gene6042-7260_t